MMLCENAQHYGIRVLHFVKPFFAMPIKLLKSELVNFSNHVCLWFLTLNCIFWKVSIDSDNFHVTDQAIIWSKNE